MKLKDILSESFHDMEAKWLARLHPTSRLWRNCLSIGSGFCKAVVANGYLSWEQMVEAAVLYRLGESRNHGVIFWQIDLEERVRDGKIMYYRPDCHRDKGRSPTWVHTIIQRRHDWEGCQASDHCFFGLHLVANPDNAEKRVCIVEAEKSAFILSQLYPRDLWLAAGGLFELNVEKFRPLRKRTVVLFPDTDLKGEAFKRWFGVAQEVMEQPFWEESPPIRVSPVLEAHASFEQKKSKIDLVDFIFQSKK